MSFINILLRSNLSRDIRNFFNFRPNFSYNPRGYQYSVSDFFFWSNNKNLKTIFFLNNLASQVLPGTNTKDHVIIFIYSHEGELLKKIDYTLEPYESKKIKFNELKIQGFGSFCVFHTFDEIEKKLKPHKSFLSERGYLGFSVDDINWNFIHGNTACVELYKDLPKNLLCKTYFKNMYRPQIIFDNSSLNTLIMNNPSNTKINIDIQELDNQNQTILENTYEMKKKSTSLIDLSQKTSLVKIFSNFLLHRPLIFKKYKDTLDILHG